MSEIEKQEGQKTVVAFVTGLLIGGLLVWVFATPSDDKKDADYKDGEKMEDHMDDDHDDHDHDEDDHSDDVDGSDADSVNEDTAEAPAVRPGNGALNVSDQPAGASVQLGNVTFPNEIGWIFVRGYNDGVASPSVRGAILYSLEDGNVPTEVPLVANTVAGQQYQVTFQTDDGSRTFSGNAGVLVEGIESVFTAQ